MKPYRITVFGGAQPLPDQPAYHEAYLLGKYLGESGFVVLTGGYMGTMEAVSCGASETGAHVIGVTCEQIELWRNASPNPWVKEEIRCKTLRERLFTLIDECDAALALPGGVGTLTEISYFWNEMIIQAIQPRPLIAIGEGWKTLMTSFLVTMADYTPTHYHQYLSFTPDVISAKDVLLAYFNKTI